MHEGGGVGHDAGVEAVQVVPLLLALLDVVLLLVEQAPRGVVGPRGLPVLENAVLDFDDLFAYFAAQLQVDAGAAVVDDVDELLQLLDVAPDDAVDLYLVLLHLVDLGGHVGAPVLLQDALVLADVEELLVVHVHKQLLGAALVEEEHQQVLDILALLEVLQHQRVGVVHELQVEVVEGLLVPCDVQALLAPHGDGQGCCYFVRVLVAALEVVAVLVQDPVDAGNQLLHHVDVVLADGDQPDRLPQVPDLHVLGLQGPEVGQEGVKACPGPGAQLEPAQVEQRQHQDGNGTGEDVNLILQLPGGQGLEDAVAGLGLAVDELDYLQDEVVGDVGQADQPLAGEQVGGGQAVQGVLDGADQMDQADAEDRRHHGDALGGLPVGLLVDQEQHHAQIGGTNAEDVGPVVEPAVEVPESLLPAVDVDQVGQVLQGQHQKGEHGEGVQIVAQGHPNQEQAHQLEQFVEQVVVVAPVLAGQCVEQGSQGSYAQQNDDGSFGPGLGLRARNVIVEGRGYVRVGDDHQGENVDDLQQVHGSPGPNAQARHLQRVHRGATQGRGLQLGVEYIVVKLRQVVHRRCHIALVLYFPGATRWTGTGAQYRQGRECGGLSQVLGQPLLDAVGLDNGERRQLPFLHDGGVRGCEYLFLNFTNAQIINQYSCFTLMDQPLPQSPSLYFLPGASSHTQTQLLSRSLSMALGFRLSYSLSTTSEIWPMVCSISLMPVLPLPEELTPSYSRCSGSASLNPLPSLLNRLLKQWQGQVSMSCSSRTASPALGWQGNLRDTTRSQCVPAEKPWSLYIQGMKLATFSSLGKEMMPSLYYILLLFMYLLLSSPYYIFSRSRPSSQRKLSASMGFEFLSAPTLSSTVLRWFLNPFTMLSNASLTDQIFSQMDSSSPYLLLANLVLIILQMNSGLFLSLRYLAVESRAQVAVKWSSRAVAGRISSNFLQNSSR